MLWCWSCSRATLLMWINWYSFVIKRGKWCSNCFSPWACFIMTVFKVRKVFIKCDQHWVTLVQKDCWILYFKFWCKLLEVTPDTDPNCAYSCQAGGGCSVTYTGPPRSGPTSGSCFSQTFGGSCSGTPPECQDCNQVCLTSVLEIHRKDKPWSNCLNVLRQLIAKKRR